MQLFDNALCCTRTDEGTRTQTESVFVFAPPSGHKHRNTWLVCGIEVQAAHAFARRNNFSEDATAMALVMKYVRGAMQRMIAARDSDNLRADFKLPFTVALDEPAIDASLASLVRRLRDGAVASLPGCTPASRNALLRRRAVNRLTRVSPRSL